MKLDKDEIELILEEVHSCEELFKSSKDVREVIAGTKNMDLISAMLLPRELAELLIKVTDYYVLLACHTLSDEFSTDVLEKAARGEIHVLIANEIIHNKLKGDKAKTILEIIDRRLRAGEQVNDETATTLFAFERSLNRFINKGVKQ